MAWKIKGEINMTKNPNISTDTEGYLYELISDLEDYVNMDMIAKETQVKELASFLQVMSKKIITDYDTYVLE